tara:strand:- start:4023 stop:5723 length:1701 start_codon:yes stop_codon:yes gene_type:complete
MFFGKKLLNNILKVTFVIIFIFFSTLEAKNLDRYNKAEYLADYFSGVLLLNESKYKDSYNYLKKLDGLEESHPDFSSKYIYSLINSGNISEAFNYSKKLDRENKNNFESDLIIGIRHLENSKFELAKEYFFKAKKRNPISVLNNYIANTLYIWSDLKYNNIESAKTSLYNLDSRFENLKKIQNVFLHCYFDSSDTSYLYSKLISDQNIDFSRYFYFYSKYLNDKDEKIKAKKIIDDALKKNPRNLLLNQYKHDLNLKKSNIDFNCKKETNVIAELLYIAANALSSQSYYQSSNFYLNLSKYLNNNFNAFDILLAENFYKIKDLKSANKIYKKLILNGTAFKWYSHKQIAKILIQENKKDEALKLLKKSYNELPDKSIYEKFDYAEFLKNNDQFNDSIKYFTEVLEKINPKHPLFPEVADGRGVAHERNGDWDKAEKDLLASLKASPNQAYVINYLAYTWIEKGIKIEKSLKMLEKANEIKSNDPYIIDSLGWALFKLKRYNESKDFLQLAVSLMPSDPVVNDHYGDVLWKIGNEIQARYYWGYVLNLDKAEKDLKVKIEQKLIKGL